MALEDIVYSEGDNQNFIVEASRGDVGVLEGILSEGGSNSGIPCNEIPEKEGGGGQNIFIHLE